MRQRIINLIRTWKLPVSMLCGIILYYILEASVSSGTEGALYGVISHIIQPLLIFAMLTLSFLKVRLHDLKPHRWHVVVLMLQALIFALCAILALMAGNAGFPRLKIILEGAMLCFICPTATAGAVIVQKLGGSLSGIVTYIVVCNTMVAVVAPAFLTLVEPHAGMDFMSELFLIMGKVFPLLLCPLFLAVMIQHYAPRLRDRLLAIPDMAFYLWLVALALAITVTVRTIANSDIAPQTLAGLAAVSLASCIMQFWMGRRTGMRLVQPTKAPDEWKRHKYDPATYTTAKERSAITAGQAMGQKNTVFAIWMGLMFLDPVTSVTGGFYSIWHNIVNSWQLYKKNKA